MRGCVRSDEPDLAHGLDVLEIESVGEFQLVLIGDAQQNGNAFQNVESQRGVVLDGEEREEGAPIPKTGAEVG